MRKFFITGSIVLSVILFSFIIIGNVMANNSYIIDKNVEGILELASKNAAAGSTVSYSSNPYDYITNNTNFDNIVNLGVDALPLIKKKIEKSGKSGLAEYILTIAAEKIAKVNLKNEEYGWANGKEWVAEWNKHLYNVQDNIERILNTNMDQATKDQSLIQLGVPAIPFLIDKMEQGNKEVANALHALAGSDKAEMISEKASSADDTRWAKAVKPKFENVRRMVLDFVAEQDK